MKTALAERQVETGGLQSRGSFSIKPSAKAFRILSDGLYSDKPLAVVRELSCNAFDAHVAAGKRDAPFEVHLPNTLEPFFSVKDFGVGLSDDHVMQLYTTYFESTKTESDDFIGALGLGSKSPFSYVDSFTVVSRFNGTKSIYGAFIGENGFPQIARMSAESTDEPNGLEVSMPVLRKDFNAFTQKAEQILKRFKPLPIVKGTKVAIVAPKNVIETPHWAIRDFQNTYSGATAIQGNVPYPISTEAFSGLSPLHRDLLKLDVDLYFDIGQLEVAASREALQYDARTSKNIIDRLNQFATEIPTHFKDYFASCKTLWETKVLFSKLRSKIGWTLWPIISKQLTWKGQLIQSQYVKVDLFTSHIDQASIAHLGYHDTKRKHWKLDYSLTADFEASEGTEFYWDDLTTRNPIQRLRHNTHARDIVIIKTADKAVFNLVFEACGNPPSWTKISDLAEPPKVVRPRTLSNLKKVYRRENGSWIETTKDVSEGGFFIHLSNWEPMWGGKEVPYLDHFIGAAYALGIDTSEVFGFPATYKTIPDKNPGWVELFTALRDKVVEMLKNKEFAQRWADDESLAKYMGSNVAGIVNTYIREKWTPARMSRPFGKLLVADQQHQRLPKETVEAVNSVITSNLFGLEAPKRKPRTDFAKLAADVLMAYPLLGILHSERTTVAEALIYINAKDKLPLQSGKDQ